MSVIWHLERMRQFYHCNKPSNMLASLMVLMRFRLSPPTELADGNPMYEVKMNVVWSPAEPRAVATELG